MSNIEMPLNLNHYELEDGSTNYSGFLEALLPIEYDDPDYTDVMHFIRDDLTRITVEKGGGLEEKKISPSSSTNDTVALMQKKLHELSPDTEPQELENFENERPLTIALFRVLNRLPSLFQRYGIGTNYESLTTDLRFKLEGLIASTDREKYWRTPVLDLSGSVLFKSQEDLDGKNGYRSNPDGKVSLDEMNCIVLPRVIEILKSIKKE